MPRMSFIASAFTIVASTVAVAHASSEHDHATLNAQSDELVQMELGRRAVQKAPKFDVVKDMLKHGNFRGAEGAEKVPPIMMNNISMLQMKEMVPNLHELGELRFERIETALSAVEDKVDQLLGKKYEHGYLVLEGSQRSRAVRAMAPRGRGGRLDHALMLERWDWFYDACTAVAEVADTIATAVVEVVTVIVDVVAEVVTTIVEVAIKAIKAVSKFLSGMMKAVQDMLSAIAGAILRAAIGCDPLNPALDMFSTTASAVTDKIVGWVKSYIVPGLEDPDLERDEDFERHMDDVKAYEDKKAKCLKAFDKKMRKVLNDKKKECIKGFGQPSLERLAQELGRSVDMERSDKDMQWEEWFKNTATCRKQHNIGFHEIGVAFKRALASGESCSDLGAPPVLAEPVVQKLKTKSMERAANSMERRGLAELERERGITLESLFTPEIRESMGAALGKGEGMCTNLFTTSSDLERLSEEEKKQGLEREADKCPGDGCEGCCDHAVCLSIELSVEGSVQVKAVNIGASAGGELGCCLSSGEHNKDKKTGEKKQVMKCFGAIGGGLSLETPGETGVELKGAITFTLLRDIGDVSGHALTAGLSMGPVSLAAVWGVGSNAETALELRQDAQDEGTSVCAEGHLNKDGTCHQDGTGFIDQMMGTAFVGITISVSGKIRDLVKDGFTFDPAKTTKYSGSIDVGYAHGWELDPGFNGETSPPSPPPKPKTPDNPYCQVVIFYDAGSPRTETINFYKSNGNSHVKQKDGDSHFENDISHIQLNSFPSGKKVCDYVRVFDEDEGCGVTEDSQKLSANSAGYLGKTRLKDDIHNDAACFDVFLT